MNKRTIGIILAAVVMIGGFFWLTKPKPANSTSSVAASNHVEGLGSKKVTLVEYGDYQCPACGAYHPILKSIYNTYKDQIFFQFRNYPLESLHQNARAGARAAEAANIQGKFWEMHDLIYENQKDWESSSDPLSYYKSYAEKVGVKDMAKFEKDYRSSVVNDIINADLKEGAKFSITGTPTFVLNGKKIENPRDQTAFNKLIDDTIAKQTPKTSN